METKLKKIRFLTKKIVFSTDLKTYNVNISPVENQNDLELDFKVFSLLILVVEAL